jgi:hypothetical protein
VRIKVNSGGGFKNGPPGGGGGALCFSFLLRFRNISILGVVEAVEGQHNVNCANDCS